MSTNPLSGFTDTGAVTEALKIHYKDLRVRNMVYKDNPLLAMVPKFTKFGGLSMPIPIRFHDPQRRSADFTTGKANTSTSGLKQFSITRVKDYGFAFIDGETILASRGDQNAFLRYLTMEIDGAINSLSRSLAVSLYGDGSGAIGAVNGTDPSGAKEVTLAKTEDITNFEVGMDIVFAEDSGEALRAGGTLTIESVDRQAGSFKVDADLNAAVAAGDSIFQAGDYTAADDKKKVFGLEAWLPAAVASDDNFNTVNRFADPTRLAGVKFDGSSMPIEEALIGAASSVARDGGRPDTAFCDFATYASLEKSLGSRVRYNTVKAPKVDIGFSGITVAGPKGDINILPDYNCTPDVMYMLQMDTWVLATLGDAPQFLDQDGNKMLRDASDDAYEVRLGYYGNLGCYAPGYNCRIALA